MPMGMFRSRRRRPALFPLVPRDVDGDLLEPALAPAGLGHDGRRENRLQSSAHERADNALCGSENNRRCKPSDLND